MSRELHPNLARIAAAYDDIVARHSRGEMSTAQAKLAVASLVARDDNGVQWKIDEATGRWKYRDSTGEYMPAQPPSSGIPSLTPWQAGSGYGDNPDDRVLFTETFSPVPDTAAPKTQRSRALVAASVALLFAVAAVILWP